MRGIVLTTKDNSLWLKQTIGSLKTGFKQRVRGCLSNSLNYWLICPPVIFLAGETSYTINIISLALIYNI
ncbi:MAG: hypothetical protein A3D13_08570 [Planctomycetes bacterium RIFCSPHIGHO2_02_FULL_40_12]|nr:MAG: hypothetical protein A3D13_08570 [Planctomycetes bacterium RIFCSPHIGHO2_02_FULL_40_12]OHC01826.1 MAG: hypothetical protein A3H23_03275 [Planctomycetes bacterium RIFCSPLOWO2_12_FULL_40_19]